MDLIQEAATEFNSRNYKEQILYTQFAKAKGVDRSTLARRHKGVLTSREVKAVN